MENIYSYSYSYSYSSARDHFVTKTTGTDFASHSISCMFFCCCATFAVCWSFPCTEVASLSEKNTPLYAVGLPHILNDRYIIKMHFFSLVNLLLYLNCFGLSDLARTEEGCSGSSRTCCPFLGNILPPTGKNSISR